MPVIIHKSELVRRALVYLDDRRKECPEKSRAELMDEAGMKFNLSPVDAAALEHFILEAPKNPCIED